ncbi:MAG: cytochrome b/b6 domain-containing protein [Pseudomonadota bacterium]
MPKRSAPHRYGSVAVTFHWLSAVLLVVMLFSGSRVAEIDNPQSKLVLLRVHVCLGVAVLVMMLLRVGWWLAVDTKPVSVPMPAWQAWASRALHVLLYVVVFGMGISGLGMLVLSDAFGPLFGAVSAALPDFWSVAPRAPHGVGARVLVVCIGLHAAAALYHQFVLRDGLLRRMWY